jgi:hypothetical protein
VLRLPRLKGGVGHKTLTLIWMGALAPLAVTDLPNGLIGVPFALVLNWILAWFFKKDHHILQVYDRYERMAPIYSAGIPGFRTKQAVSPSQIRPRGYARQLPI